MCVWSKEIRSQSPLIFVQGSRKRPQQQQQQQNIKIRKLYFQSATMYMFPLAFRGTIHMYMYCDARILDDNLIFSRQLQFHSL